MLYVFVYEAQSALNDLVGGIVVVARDHGHVKELLDFEYPTYGFDYPIVTTAGEINAVPDHRGFVLVGSYPTNDSCVPCVVLNNYYVL